MAWLLNLCEIANNLPYLSIIIRYFPLLVNRKNKNLLKFGKIILPV